MRESEPSSRWLMKAALMTLLVVSALVMVRVFPPTQYSFYPKCMLHQWTGLYCAGCGGTRAVASLAQGRWLTALQMNPLLIVGTPIIAVLIFFQRRYERRSQRTTPSITWLIASVVIVYSFARNIPSPSSSPLAPPANWSDQPASRGQLPSEPPATRGEELGS